MSLKYIEGFDGYADNLSNFPSSGDVRMTSGDIPAGCHLQGANSRFGFGKAWSFDASNELEQAVSQVPAMAFNVSDAYDAGDTVVFGLAYRLRVDTIDGPISFMSLGGATGNSIFNIYVTPLGYFGVAPGHGQAHNGVIIDDLVALSNHSALAPQEWAWVEVEFYVGAVGAGSHIKIWKSGSLVLDWSGTLPNPDAPSSPMNWTWSDIILGAAQCQTDSVNNDFWTMGGPWDMDDFYCIQVDGTAPNARLGDSRIDTIYPESETALTGYARTGGVNTSGALGQGSNDGDTSYYEADAQDDQAIFDSTGTLNGTPGAIYGVEVAHISRKTQTGDRNLVPLIRQGGTDYEGTPEAASSTYAQYRSIWAEQPNGGGEWSKTDVEAAKFGVKIDT